jgi:hypothetical protein
VLQLKHRVDQHDVAAELAINERSAEGVQRYVITPLRLAFDWQPRPTGNHRCAGRGLTGSRAPRATTGARGGARQGGAAARRGRGKGGVEAARQPALPLCPAAAGMACALPLRHQALISSPPPGPHPSSQLAAVQAGCPVRPGPQQQRRQQQRLSGAAAHVQPPARRGRGAGQPHAVAVGGEAVAAAAGAVLGRQRRRGWRRSQQRRRAVAGGCRRSQAGRCHRGRSCGGARRCAGRRRGCGAAGSVGRRRRARWQRRPQPQRWQPAGCCQGAGRRRGQHQQHGRRRRWRGPPGGARRGVGWWAGQWGGPAGHYPGADSGWVAEQHVLDGAAEDGSAGGGRAWGVAGVGAGVWVHARAREGRGGGSQHRLDEQPTAGIATHWGPVVGGGPGPC